MKSGAGLEAGTEGADKNCPGAEGGTRLVGEGL